MRDHPNFTSLASRIARGSVLLLAHAAVAAQPAQHPLLVNTAGAKPNLMISLDNSGSMALPFPDDYNVRASGTVSGGSWAAQRSSQFNSLYYNPRITYLPRLGADGQPLVPDDGVVFVSNEQSNSHLYRVFTNGSLPQAQREYVIEHSSYANNPPVPAGWTRSVEEKRDALFVPVHVTYKASDITANQPRVFSYTTCNSISTEPTGHQCNSWEATHVRYGSFAAIRLPSDHKRTDCGPVFCSTQKEIQNILTWYRYYLYRLPATVTAIGQALNDPRLNNRIRVGYMPINLTGQPMSLVPGKDVDQPRFVRGVRTWLDGSADKAQVYTWLYNQVLMGGTPLHNSIEKVAQYLQVPANAVENPWALDPSRLDSASNPEMTCRRSYNLLFSDGAWKPGGDMGNGLEFDNREGPEFSRINSKKKSEKFGYNPRGGTDRRLYTPYPSEGVQGLADLTAQYFWHKDLRESLDNQVATRAGQPTFWQNMTTYTVGYLIKPSGSLPGATSGLTFDQIDAYRTGFAVDGFTAAPKPSWPAGPASQFNDPSRVNDFIHAGYTGGGRGFSVQSAEEIRNVFDTILSDILNASGSDAGIDIPSPEQGVRTLGGALKYGVEFRTFDNSGDVKATLLNARGDEVLISKDANNNTLNTPSADYWIASKQIPDHTDRRIFSLGEGNVPFELKGNFSALPSNVQAALKTGKDAQRIPNDSRFVDYLRGKDPETDAQRRVFRPRMSPIGAIVNSPPLLMGDEDNLAYNIRGNVTGKDQYAAFRNQIRASSPSLFVATNAGVVHAFSADKGRELAAFMPRRSMTKLLDQANATAGFEYTLDGPLSRNDIYSGGQWNQMVIGTGGRGTKLVYALRSPLKPNGDRTPGASDFLWEAGPDTMNSPFLATGYMSNQVRSGQTESGHWVAVVNSGHYNGYSDGSRAGLVVLDARTGQTLRTIPLPFQFSAGRGLGGVTLERDTRRRVVAAYAGDANGNLWRFNLRGAPTDWRVAYNQPLFTTPNNRPIYAAPAWQAHPLGGNIVVVTTGIVLETADLADTAVNEGAYGIWDPTSVTGVEQSGFSTVGVSSLLEQTPVKLEVTSGDRLGYSISRNPVDWNIHKGWFIKLTVAPGERGIDQVRGLGSSVQFNTVTVDSSVSNDTENCTATDLPKNTAYILNALDGAGLPAFDVDGDGKVDDVAMVVTAMGGYSRNVRLINYAKDNSGIMESYGEGDPDSTGCKSAGFSIAGLLNGTLSGETSCGVNQGPNSPRPWSRQQYQLIGAPL